MKYLNLIIMIFILTNCIGQTRNIHEKEPLFLISNNDKLGFIDSTGKVIIEPKFLSLGEFTDGLAFARTAGTYGYIDKTGNYVIQPQFDYATPFSDGIAIVYKDGKPFYVNISGQNVFECNFSKLGQFENGRAIIKTSTKKFGIINKIGELFIDTIFTQLKPISDGMLIVQGINHHPYADKKKGINRNFEVGVIDTIGNFIIPYGKIQEISDYEDGYFKVETIVENLNTNDGYSTKTSIIDRNGNTIISKDHKNNCYLAGNLHCGIAKMYLYRYWIPEEDGVISTTEKGYQGYMNLKGEIFINDTTFKTVEDFSDNRAFVMNDDRKYSIINTKGKFVSKNSYNRIIGKGFKNGLAYVAVDWKWGVIDTNANFIFKPQFSYIYEKGIFEDYFFFSGHNEENKNGSIGVASINGSILIKPTIQSFDKKGFKNGLLKCDVNGKQTYLNKNGKIVWQDDFNDLKLLSNLNIDYMNIGYFKAYSFPNKLKPSNIWTKSKKSIQKDSMLFDFSENSLSIIVNQNTNDTFSKTNRGVTVYVVNNTNNKIYFNVQDNRLYMKVQALNSIGEWNDIEYLPTSDCGNSYHTFSLESKYFWSFVTPIYEGHFKTKLRIKLKYIDPTDKSDKDKIKKEIIVYSNEYDAIINPGQFWRKHDFYPNEIINPYSD